MTFHWHKRYVGSCPDPPLPARVCYARLTIVEVGLASKSGAGDSGICIMKRDMNLNVGVHIEYVRYSLSCMVNSVSGYINIITVFVHG